MKAITLRPLASFCLVFYFVTAITRGAESKTAALIISAVLGLLLFMGYFISKKNLYLRTLAIISVAAAMSLSFTALFIDAPMAKAMELIGEREIKGKIAEVEWVTSYSGSYIARIYEIDGESSDIQIVLESGTVFERGDTFSGTALLTEIKNDDSFNKRDYYGRMGIYLESLQGELRYTGTKLSLNDRLSELNSQLSARTVMLLGEDDGGIAASLFLGNKSYLSQKLENAVSHMGISHLIALSGLHLTIICTLIGFLLKNVNARIRLIVTLLPICFYILLTGFSPSILRAGFMLICMSIISFFGKASDTPTNLGITLLLLLLMDPVSAYDIGLQLSASAMMGIFAYTRIMRSDVHKPYSRKRDIAKRIFSPFILGFFAMSFTMPVVYHYFGSFSLLSFLLTVPYSLAVTAILWLSPLVLIAGNIPLLGQTLIFPVKLICTLFREGALLTGFNNGLTVSESSPAIMMLMVGFIITVSVALTLDNATARKITAGASAMVFAAFITVTSVAVAVSFSQVTLLGVEIPSGDGFIIKSDDACIMVDISGGSKKMARALADGAASMDIYTAHCIVIADPHTKHVSQLSRLEEYMDIETVMMPDDEESRRIGKELEGYSIVYYQRGDSLDFGDYEINTYEDVFIDRSVVPIIRMTIVTEKSTFMYMGSAWNDADMEDVQCNYIWYGGYGPRYKNEFSPCNADGLLLSQKAALFCTAEPVLPTNERLILDN